ncbi:uncharacterized protein LOC113934024 [Zalophus californianus]|uniref:Uncharacterized protein LOC113934024 n=1 Tax=Zalophus californianus TaxID=9704 RepID=A0A6J2ETU0_ZALCA|nr:uncharacterized protein LOC113934024 [Zalophus californianus]
MPSRPLAASVSHVFIGIPVGAGQELKLSKHSESPASLWPGLGQDPVLAHGRQAVTGVTSGLEHSAARPHFCFLLFVVLLPAACGPSKLCARWSVRENKPSGLKPENHLFLQQNPAGTKERTGAGPGGAWRWRRGPAGAGGAGGTVAHVLMAASTAWIERLWVRGWGCGCRSWGWNRRCSGQTAGRTAKEQRAPRPSACKSHGTRCFSAQDAEEG